MQFAHAAWGRHRAIPDVRRNLRNYSVAWVACLGLPCSSPNAIINARRLTLSRWSKLIPIAALTLASLALANPAAADGCRRATTGSGRAANPANYDPPKHYNMEKLAKSRAIANWQEKVRAACSGASTAWLRARDKKIECDGYAGGLGCEATATPARKFFR